MSALTQRTGRDGTLVVGAVLVVVGLLALATTYFHVDPSDWLGGSGWTLFILTPGVVLLVTGLLTTRQPGEGLTIAGSVVTTIGLMLLAMDRTNAYEAWAYAWALLPAAAGVGVVLHGLRSGDGRRVSAGLKLIAIATGLFLLGAWYFGNLFENGKPPVDVGDAWPLVLIGAGGIVIASAFLRRGSPRRSGA